MNPICIYDVVRSHFVDLLYTHANISSLRNHATSPLDDNSYVPASYIHVLYTYLYCTMHKGISRASKNKKNTIKLNTVWYNKNMYTLLLQFSKTLQKFVYISRLLRTKIVVVVHKSQISHDQNNVTMKCAKRLITIFTYATCAYHIIIWQCVIRRKTIISYITYYVISGTHDRFTRQFWASRRKRASCASTGTPGWHRAWRTPRWPCRRAAAAWARSGCRARRPRRSCWPRSPAAGPGWTRRSTAPRCAARPRTTRARAATGRPAAVTPCTAARGARTICPARGCSASSRSDRADRPRPPFPCRCTAPRRRTAATWWTGTAPPWAGPGWWRAAACFCPRSGIPAARNPRCCSAPACTATTHRRRPSRPPRAPVPCPWRSTGSRGRPRHPGPPRTARRDGRGRRPRGRCRPSPPCPRARPRTGVPRTCRGSLCCSRSRHPAPWSGPARVPARWRFPTPGTPRGRRYRRRRRPGRRSRYRTTSWTTRVRYRHYRRSPAASSRPPGVWTAFCSTSFWYSATAKPHRPPPANRTTNNTGVDSTDDFHAVAVAGNGWPMRRPSDDQSSTTSLTNGFFFIISEITRTPIGDQTRVFVIDGSPVVGKAAGSDIFYKSSWRTVLAYYCTSTYYMEQSISARRRPAPFFDTF